MVGREQGVTGTYDDFATQGTRNIGASILGRSMFGPIRGPWPDEEWIGWWGPSCSTRKPQVAMEIDRRPVTGS